MKNYLSVCFGDFESVENCKSVAFLMTPLVDSPHLKLNYSQGSLVLHFASVFSQEEIKSYFESNLMGLVNGFILTEISDKMTLSFPKDVMEHLLDLENEDSQICIKVDMDNIKSSWDEFEDENYMASLLEEMKSNIKSPSLDQILDKINNVGLDGLSPFEKDVLANYSKN